MCNTYFNVQNMCFWNNEITIAGYALVNHRYQYFKAFKYNVSKLPSQTGLMPTVSKVMIFTTTKQSKFENQKIIPRYSTIITGLLLLAYVYQNILRQNC